MDTILCQDLLRNAEKQGATRAAALEKAMTTRADVYTSGRREPMFTVRRETTILLEKGNGFAEVCVREDASREEIYDAIGNAIQAAGIAHSWGCDKNHAHSIDAQLRRFRERSSESDELPEACRRPKTACSAQCLVPECLRDTAKAIEPAAAFAKNLAPMPDGVQSRVVQEYIQTEETLLLGEEMHTLRNGNTALRQELRGNASVLRLPEYRIAGTSVAPEMPPNWIRCDEVAFAFAQGLTASEPLAFPRHGILMSAWSVAVIGHEASHLPIELPRAGRLAMSAEECPSQKKLPCSRSIEITLERTLTMDRLMERVPDGTVYVDAPVGWIRRDEQTIDVRFAIVAEAQGGRIVRHFVPTVLRIDLRKIWFYAKWAAQPYRRIALQCGEAQAEFQAPWVFFDIDAVGGSW